MQHLILKRIKYVSNFVNFKSTFINGSRYSRHPLNHALRSHGNNCYWYHVDTLIQKQNWNVVCHGHLQSCQSKFIWQKFFFFFCQGSTLTFVTSGLLTGKMVVLTSQRTLSTSCKKFFLLKQWWKHVISCWIFNLQALQHTFQF